MANTFDWFESKEEALSYIIERGHAVNRKEAEKYLQDHVPKESHYQEKIMKFIKYTYPESFVWKAAAGPYSQRGIPDICAVINGRFFGFEVKRPYFGVLSIMQEKTIERIRKVGGIAAVVTFPDEVKKIIEAWIWEKK